MSILLAIALAAASSPDLWIEGEMSPGLPAARRTSSVSRTPDRRPAPDLSATGAVCEAASGLADPDAFLGRIARAYSLSPADAAALSRTCAVYIAAKNGERRRLLAAARSARRSSLVRAVYGR